MRKSIFLTGKFLKLTILFSLILGTILALLTGLSFPKEFIQESFKYFLIEISTSFLLGFLPVWIFYLVARIIAGLIAGKK